MKLEEDMILARAGYNEKYKQDVPWDELKRSFMLYKRIPMIVAGESHHKPIDPNEAIGFVDAKIDDAEQVIRGTPVFYEERFHDVPAEIQRRLLHKEYVPASLGYEPFKDLRKLDHIAIGVESPVFPDIGFHAEDSFRHEETDGINKQEPEATPEESIPEVKEAVQTGLPSVTFTGEQFAQLLQTIRSLAPAPSQTTEEVVEAQEKIRELAEARPSQTEAPPEEVQESPQPKPKVEPERVIPKDTVAAVREGQWYTDADGRRVMSLKIAGSEKEKK